MKKILLKKNRPDFILIIDHYLIQKISFQKTSLLNSSLSLLDIFYKLIERNSSDSRSQNLSVHRVYGFSLTLTPFVHLTSYYPSTTFFIIQIVRSPNAIERVEMINCSIVYNISYHASLFRVIIKDRLFQKQIQ